MRDFISAGETVTVFDIAQYFYCPRKVYYLRVMGVPAKPKRKMELGRKEQTREEKRLLQRDTIYGFEKNQVKGIMRRIYLENPEIGLAGQVDTVLRMSDGELIPVDSKYTDAVAVYRGFKKQLVAYAVLLDHAFKTKTQRAILYYPQQRRTREVTIAEEDKRFLAKDVQAIRRILAGETLPAKVAKEKCGYCEVKRFCV
jgi:CRISPR-associated exonuclease Cas4